MSNTVKDIKIKNLIKKYNSKQFTIRIIRPEKGGTLKYKIVQC